ncbi:hypothetical protein C8R44DRAFT_728563 [Mycena epipterygia]|nr:hypothetical protein C8R44DRAFT_728563 [Mycena epipterygia]
MSPPKNNGWGGKRPGAGRSRTTATPGSMAKARRKPLRMPARPQHAQGLEPSPQTYHRFFGPYNTHQPVSGNSASPHTQISRSMWSVVASNSHISLDDLTQHNQQLEYIDEHDEHGDIAAGDQVIDGSLVDEASEASPDSAVHKQLLSVRKRLTEEIKRYGTTLCYRRGDFYDRPPHPVFMLQRSLDLTQLYSREVFVWLPYLLPGCPDRFKCICGLPLVRNGFNDDPIARRFRSIPADFFLCLQIASFATRDALNLGATRASRTRLGPAPFAELVSELQHRSHAESELMYVAAANFYRQTGVEKYSAFDDSQGYMLDRHHPCLLKYMGRLKGEKIFTAAYTLVNEFEEPVTDWTDLPRFQRAIHIPTALVSDFILIEDKLRTKDGIYAFKSPVVRLQPVL